jgi:serine/threonine protein kinase
MLPGERVGHYEIRGPLGAGGMGVVYRAHDARLGRDVAVKFLPAEFRSDPDRLRRFEREAQVTGALNHPNILVVFDVGTHDGAPYLVTELVEGQTLRQLLKGGAVTPKETIAIGIQLAKGLDAAHRMGVVHRDLKPENLMLTADARLKILDFGIARVISASAKPLTQDGAMVGTPGYMAPEQVRGQQTDARTDLFSAGAILYELLVGRQAFSGASPLELAYASLAQPTPDLALAGVSADVAAVVSRCLAKEASRRYQAAAELLAADRADFEKISADCRALLVDPAVAAAYEKGRELALSEAVTFALSD